VRLVARNEGVRYRGPEGVYDFDVNRDGREWTVFLPPVPEIRDQQDEPLVIKRISAALSRIWWFGVFPRRYAVKTEFRQHPLVRKV